MGAIKIQRGNTIRLVFRTRKEGEPVDFRTVSPRAYLYSTKQGLIVGEGKITILEDPTSIEILWEGIEQCHLGAYSLIMRYTIDGKQYIEDVADAFELVATSAERTPVSDTIEGVVIEIDGEIITSLNTELMQKLLDAMIKATEDAKKFLDIKQDKLVSGVNIKTINGRSVLGSGNLVIRTAGEVLNFLGEWNENESYQYYDSVSYIGCIFWAVADTPKLPPYYNNPEWKLLVGNPNFVLDITSTQGDALMSYDLNTTLIAEVYKYNQRVTPDIPSEQWSWERESAYPDSDVVWNAQHIGIGNELPITAADIPGKGVRKVKFIVKAYMNIEETIIGAVEI